jgi:hypothetical protein
VIEPLNYLNRKELMLNIMNNIEREILNLHHNSALRRKWERIPNWAKVQMFLNGNTSKAGSTSSTEQCRFLGVNPNKYNWSCK